MAAKLITLTHKIAIKLQRAVPFAVLAPGGQSGNFWIHPHKTSINVEGKALETKWGEGETWREDMNETSIKI
jgi:hypothetical protein